MILYPKSSEQLANLQQFLININMQRKPWTEQEDLALKLIVQQVGIQNWTIVAARLSQAYVGSCRAGKQCRERWINHLDLTISKKPWNRSEQKIIFQMHNIYGNKWKEIGKHLKARTQNDIKNHFYATMRKGIRRLNKLLGFKKNPIEIRKIKPVVLSKICEQQHQIEISQGNIQKISGVFALILELSKNQPTPQKCDQLLENEQLINKATLFLDKMLNQNRSYLEQKLAKKELNKLMVSNIQTIKSEEPKYQLDISQYLCLGQQIDVVEQNRPKSQGASIKMQSVFSQNDSSPTSSKEKEKNNFQKKNYKLF